MDMLDIDYIKQSLQRFAQDRDWQPFHNPKNFAMALSAEAAELLELFLWVTDGESNHLAEDNLKKQAISHEIADVILCAIRLADLLDINLQQALQEKMKINQQKYPVEKVKGKRDKYNAYTEL